MTTYKLKMVLLGDSGVGKSCIISRYVYNQYSDYLNATIGAQFLSKELLGGKSRIDIWDTAGQERFRSLIPLYIKGANIIVVVVDIQTPAHERNAQIQFWNQYIENNASSISNFRKILIYNKLDLNPGFQVEADERFDYTMCVSCKKGLYLDEFSDLVDKVSLELEPKLDQYYKKTNQLHIAGESNRSYVGMVWDYIPGTSKKCLLG